MTASAEISQPYEINEDSKITIADAVLIMQSLSNPNEYKVTETGMANADIMDRGEGLTVQDAFAIQMIALKLVTEEDLPISSADLDKVFNLEKENK